MEMRFDSKMLGVFKETRNDAARLIVDNGLKPLLDAAHLDADETYFFARQLEFVKKRSYDVLYPEFKGDWICPVSNEADTGTENITYKQYEGVGEASIINNASRDYKNVEIREKEFTQPVRSIGVSIKWTLQELRRDALKAKFGNNSAGKTATQRKTDKAIQAIRQKEERIIAAGDATAGLVGFYNSDKISEIPTGAGVNQIKADGTGNKADWMTKDADKLIRDFNIIVNYVVNNTKGVHDINTVLLSNEYNTRLATVRIPNTNTSVLTYLLSVHEGKGLEIVPYDRVNLAAAGADTGTLTEQWIMAYDRSPNTLTQEIPQPLEIFPPRLVAHGEYEAGLHERHGGIQIYYPKACVRAKITL